MNIFKQGRINKGYTQEQLAEMIGIDRSSVSRWESGDTLPRTDRLIYLSELLSVDLLLLIGSKTNKKNIT